MLWIRVAITLALKDVSRARALVHNPPMNTKSPTNPAPAQNAGSGFSYWGEAKATLALATPIAATMVAVMVIETTDVLMIGRLGEEALAASGLAVTIWVSFLLFAMGVLNAIPTLVSQAVAQDDPVAVRRTARQGLWAALALTIPSSLFLFFFGQDVLILFGQEPELAALAQSYLNYLVWSLIPVCMFISLRLTMASYGMTMPALIGVLLAIPVNALLNWMLIWGHLGAPEMGLPGAGLSTLLVDSITLIGLIIYMRRVSPFRELEMFRRMWRSDWPRFRQVFSIGLPAGALSVLEHSLFSASTVMMGWVGVTALAAHNVSFQVISILFMIPHGLSQAANIRLAHAAGRRSLDEVRRRGWTNLGLTVCLMTCTASTIFLVRDHAIGVFLDSDDPARETIVMFGATFLGIAVIFQMFDGLQIVATAVLRGINDTKMPMLIGSICFIPLGILPAYYLAFELGMNGVGIWLGLLIGLVCAAITLVLRFWWLTQSSTRAFRGI